VVRDGKSDPGAIVADVLQPRRVLAVSGSRAPSCIRVCDINGSMPTSGRKTDLDSYCFACCLPDICWNSVMSSWNARRYGHKTWEWAAGLRGYLHPLLFAALYKVHFSLSTAGKLEVFLTYFSDKYNPQHDRKHHIKALAHLQGLYFAGVDTTWVIARSPQLLQASFAAITDIFVYKLARLQFGQRAARYTC